MSEYKSIKDLVIETCISGGEFPSYEKLTSLVLEHFPTSRWQKTHYAWYKSKIKRGEIAVPGFSECSESTVDANNDQETEILETIDASISLERDLHSYFASRITEIESGLSVVDDGIEYQTDAGRIDILAEDASGIVVIELKAGRAKDNALGQLLGYVGCLTTDQRFSGKSVRGILIASDFDQRVVYAAKAIPTVQLLKYRVSFALKKVN